MSITTIIMYIWKTQNCMTTKLSPYFIFFPVTFSFLYICMTLLNTLHNVHFNQEIF